MKTFIVNSIADAIATVRELNNLSGATLINGEEMDARSILGLISRLGCNPITITLKDELNEKI